MDERGLNLDQLTHALEMAGAEPIDRVLEKLVKCLSEAISNARCTLWWTERNENRFGFRVSHGNSLETSPPPRFLAFDDARDAGFLDMNEARELSEESLAKFPFFQGCLIAGIYFDEQTNGILALKKSAAEPWMEEEIQFLTRASASASTACCHLEHLSKRTQLGEILQMLSAATLDNEVYNIAAADGKTLLDCDRAVVRRINFDTGALEFVRSRPTAKQEFSLDHGKGVTGLALQKSSVYRISDVTKAEWKEIYRPLWLPSSRSELAAPIVLPGTRAQIGTKIELVEKPFGVLNFESTAVSAFSSFHEECVIQIARHMARVLERIDFDKKIEKLRKVEPKLASIRDWDSFAEKVMAEIQDTLGYKYVSFSMVDYESGMIRCTKVRGVSEPDEFRKAAVHRLDSNNIQADVVRNRQAEVPEPTDPRLSRELSDRFGLGGLIRVFLPVLSATHDKVYGTVSAGYDGKYRRNIYERDIQVLKGFVDFAGSVLEVRRRGVITRFSHEMNAPLSAIRNNLSWLQTRRRTMREELVDQVLEDMATDAEILLHQVERVEYLWTGGPQSAKRALDIRPVLLFKDIIFKTINQLTAMVREKNLDPTRVTYDDEDVHKVRTVYVDKGKISQVIFNLFVNAIKYSENPGTFQIRIGAEVRSDSYVIKFRDWGIGVPEGLEEKIFEEWFRAPSSAQNEVSGSGLGLTIARQLMREHGGDVVLAHRAKPTEFHVLIPKRVQESR